MRLKNKTAVISGATGGIGEATSKLFLAEGANVVMVGRDEEKLNTLHNSFKDQSKLSTYVADSNDEDAIKDCITFAKDKYGSIDVVFANAGTEGEVKPLTEYTKAVSYINETKFHNYFIKVENMISDADSINAINNYISYINNIFTINHF